MPTQLGVEAGRARAPAGTAADPNLGVNEGHLPYVPKAPAIGDPALEQLAQLKNVDMLGAADAPLAANAPMESR